MGAIVLIALVALLVLSARGFQASSQTSGWCASSYHGWSATSSAVSAGANRGGEGSCSRF